MEAAEQDYRAAGGYRDVHRSGDTPDVEKGQDGDENLASVLVPEPVLELNGIGHQVLVGQHGRFGDSRGAAGVREQGQVRGRVNLGGMEDGLLTLGHDTVNRKCSRSSRISGHDNMSDRRLRQDLLDSRVKVRLADYGLCSGVGQLVRELVGLVHGVAGDGPSPGLLNAKEDGYQFRAVLEEVSYAVSPCSRQGRPAPRQTCSKPSPVPRSWSGTTRSLTRRRSR